jgi:hypothetical protein
MQESDVEQSSVRRHTPAVGSKLDERVTVPDEYNFPDSQRLPMPMRNRLTIAINGTYIRSDRIEISGWTAASRVAILANGADGLTSLVEVATDKGTRAILDWFHISMRYEPSNK